MRKGNSTPDSSSREENTKAKEDLRRIIEAPSSADETISKAAKKLAELDPQGAGPYLTRGLQRTNDIWIARMLTDLLRKVGYRESAPVILEWLQKDTLEDMRGTFIRALTAFNFESARSLVQKHCSGIESFLAGLGDLDREAARHSSSNSGLATACLSYMGPWGPLLDGVHVMLVPPKTARVGQEIALIIAFENNGLDRLRKPIPSSLSYLIDGKTYPPKGSIIPATQPSLPPQYFLAGKVILPISFKEPGKHRIQVVWSPTQTRYSQEKKGSEEIRLDPIASNIVELEVAE